MSISLASPSWQVSWVIKRLSSQDVNLSMEEMLDWMTPSGCSEAIFSPSSDERKCFDMVVALGS